MREVSPAGLGKIQSDEAGSDPADGLSRFDRGDSDHRHLLVSRRRAGGAEKSRRAATRNDRIRGLLLPEGARHPQTVIDRAFAELKRFHELPLEQKMTLRLKHCGLLSIGYEPDSVGQSSKTTFTRLKTRSRTITPS